MDAIELYCETLREFLANRDTNIGQYARKASVDRKNIDNVLKRRSFPSVRTATKIADFENCSLDYLFWLTDKPCFIGARDDKSFALRYAELKKENRLTDYKVAKACGVNGSSVYKWKNRGVVPNFPVLISLTEILHCSLDYLVGRSDRN